MEMLVREVKDDQAKKMFLLLPGETGAVGIVAGKAYYRIGLRPELPA
jgi:hypothetical protein